MSPKSIEYIVFTIYLLVGPVMWGLYAAGVYQSRKRMMLVRNPPDPIPDPPPPVTILIPAKDEGERIRDCIASALAQNYPNFNVVTIDDRSSDCTGDVMDQMAAANPRLKVVHIPPGPVPEGWTGKNNALHTGVQHADGQWLLFVDSDVILQPDALPLTLGLAHTRRYNLVSLIPLMESHTLWEGVLIPLCAAAAGAVFTAALTNNNLLKNTAFANGQYLMVQRAAYESIGGHSAVRGQFCEDMAMARMFKKADLRPRLSWGTELCRVRMYDSLSKILRGWSRIFFASAVGRPWPSLVGIAFIFICCYSMIPAAAWGVYRCIHPINMFSGYGWLGAVAAHWTLMTIQIGMMYRWMCNPRRYALLFPVAAMVLVYILINAVRMCITRKVEWRGTSYSHRIEATTKSGS